MVSGFDQALINGQMVTATGDEILPVFDPSTEELVSEVRSASVADVAEACAAAVAATDTLRDASLDDRRQMVQRLLNAYEAHTDTLVDAVVDEIGLPEHIARDVQVETGHMHFVEALKAIDDIELESFIGSTLIEQRPVGVTAMITPWNWPLTQIVLKVAPALLAGCPAVLKPSEFSPRQTAIFMQAVIDADLPAGSLNIINGAGPSIGAALVARPEIRFVSFTGSTAAGIAVSESAAPRIGRVALELGGKSPALVLDDADLATVIPAVVEGCFANNGQSCDAPTRLLVPRHKQDETVDLVRQACEAQVVGDPRTVPGVTLGPVINSRQWGRVQDLIRAGIEGSTLVTGGEGRPDGIDSGYFVRPTAFMCGDRSERIAAEEVFGPVLSILAYDSEAEAIDMANDTTYGLAAYVYSADHDRAMSASRLLDAGQVQVNSPDFDAAAPFGGRKASGLGREGGRWGIEEFLEPVAVVGARPR